MPSSSDRSRLLAAASLVLALGCGGAADAGARAPEEPAASPGDQAIVNLLEQYFRTDDASERRRLSAEIEARPGFELGRLGELLHAADLWPERRPGVEEIVIEVGHGHRRRVSLRTPEGYTPERAWPLILALHPSGGSGASYLSSVVRLLGDRADDFVIAAPTHYRQTVLDAPPPFTPEHPVMLRELRRRFHLDSDRVYPVGRSLGGYAAWTLALLHSDLYAGAVSMAGSYGLPPDVDGIWKAFAGNLEATPVLHVWGTRDGLAVPGFEGRPAKIGSMSELNRRLSREIRELDLNVIDRPIEGAGHGGASPDRKELLAFLERERARAPEPVRHVFRHIHQASAFWLEGHRWTGDAWGRPGRRVQQRRGESRSRALGREILPLLGLLAGRVDGQTIEVETRHLDDLSVWLDGGLVDLGRPLTLKVNRIKVFEGEVEPDLGVCLAQAARDWDFDRLRCAGLRVTDGRAAPVRADDELPPLIRQR